MASRFRRNLISGFLLAVALHLTSTLGLTSIPDAMARESVTCRCVGEQVRKHVWKWVWDWEWDTCATTVSECRGRFQFNGITGRTDYVPCAYYESVCRAGQKYKYVYKYVYDYVWEPCARRLCQ